MTSTDRSTHSTASPRPSGHRSDHRDTPNTAHPAYSTPEPVAAPAATRSPGDLDSLPAQADAPLTTSDRSPQPDPQQPDPARATSPRRRRTPARSRRTGFGTVRQLASGRWQARYTDSDAIRRPAPLTFATRREAEDWITTRRAEHLRGEWRSPEHGAISLSDYVADYLAGRVDLSPATREKYARLRSDWLAADLVHPSGRPVNLGRFELRNLTPAVVREWYTAALSEAQNRAAERLAASDRRRATAARHAARCWAIEHGHPVKRTGRLSPAVLDAWRASGSPAAATLDLPVSEPSRDAGKHRVASAYALLRSVLNTAHRDGLISANPCNLPGAAAVRSPERPHATPEEVHALAERMPPRYAAAVIVAAWSGLRGGELFALTRAHVDLDRGTLRVERALVEVTGQPIRFGPPKTVTSLRTVHLPRPVVDVLAEHMATWTRPGPDALIFANTAGRPLDRGARSRHFRRACAALGLHRLRWHDLRHTGATYAAQAGASLRELQARLGHSTVAAAMTYQHATAERDRALAERMADAIAVPTASVHTLRAVR